MQVTLLEFEEEHARSYNELVRSADIGPDVLATPAAAFGPAVPEQSELHVVFSSCFCAAHAFRGRGDMPQRAAGALRRGSPQQFENAEPRGNDYHRQVDVIGADTCCWQTGGTRTTTNIFRNKAHA